MFAIEKMNEETKILKFIMSECFKILKTVTIGERMAMINCIECEHKVSDKANKCPTCGFQLNKPKRGFFGFIFKWLFVLFNILMILSFILSVTIIGGSISNISDAQITEAIIGTVIIMSILIGIWIAGDIILGLFVLFTRPKS